MTTYTTVFGSATVPPSGYAYAPVALEDFVETRSTPEDLPGILEKIRGNFSSGSFFLVFFPESVGIFRALLRVSHGESLRAIGERFDAPAFQGDLVSFTIAADSPEACERIIIRKFTERKLPVASPPQDT